MHVLLVAESYPPSPFVGSVRPAALARALHQAGHRVTVIRSVRYAGPAGPEPIVDPATVLTVQARENPVRILAPHKTVRAMTRAATGGSPLPATHPGETGARRLRRWLLSLCLAPDDSQGFILPAVSAALGRHRTEPVDLLITTGPPFTDHLIGWCLAHLLGVPWAAEFRDPWLPRSASRAVQSSLADWLEQRMENLVLRRCSLAVAVTPSVGASLDQKRRALGRPANTVVALNGIPEFQPGVERRAGPLQVLHAGVLYLKRDPRPFLRAVAMGVHSGRFGAAGVRVRFMGASGETFNGTSVVQMAADLGIEGCVELVGQVPITECRRLMAQADLLLLLAQDQPAQVPNKLFDYLAARRPIVAYADRTGESAGVLARVGGHLIVPDDSPEHDDRVVGALVGSRRAEAGDGMSQAALDALQTSAQLAPLVAALERLAVPR